MKKFFVSTLAFCGVFALASCGEETATTSKAPAPTTSVIPTVAPTVQPTTTPTVQPTVAPTVAPTAEPTVTPTTAPTPKKSKIFLAGDSTVKTYKDAQFIGGWGQFLDLFLDDLEVINCANGGRSSRSVINEGRYNP